MADIPQFSPEVIDNAWRYANNANAAFDSLRKVEDDIAAVRRVAGLAMTGITVRDNVLLQLEATREARKSAFRGFQALAGVVMAAENSPFTVETKDPQEIHEDTFATGETLRTLTEMRLFAEYRGYKKGDATKVWNILARNATFVEVSDFDQYTAFASTADPGENQLRMVRIAQTTWRQRPELVQRIDAENVYENVRQWVEKNPTIRNLGVGLINFLADYVNHALPNKEKLPVEHNKPRPWHEIDYSVEGLLDSICITGTDEEVAVVTGKSLLRVAVAGGYTPQSAPPFTKILATIAKDIAEKPASRDAPHPIWAAEGWAYLGPNKTRGGAGLVTAWGVTPAAFKALVSELEHDPIQRKATPYLSEKGFTVMRAFAAELEKQTQDRAG